jgi:hypothetical protein
LERDEKQNLEGHIIPLPRPCQSLKEAATRFRRLAKRLKNDARPGAFCVRALSGGMSI